MNDDLVVLKEKLNETLQLLIKTKPGDRSEQDRSFSIMKTDLEKLIAYYHYHILTNHNTE